MSRAHDLQCRCTPHVVMGAEVSGRLTRPELGSFSQHHQDEGTRRCRGEMFERVSRNDVSSQLEDRMFEELEKLGGSVAEKDRRVDPLVRIESGKEENNGQRTDHGPGLYERVRFQVIRGVPPDDAAHTEDDQRDEKDEARRRPIAKWCRAVIENRRHARSIVEQHGDETGKRDRHRQSIPQQSFARDIEMKPRRSEGRECEAEEERPDRCGFTARTHHDAPPTQRGAPGNTDDEKRSVRQNVRSVWDAEKRPAIGEVEKRRTVRTRKYGSGVEDDRDENDDDDAHDLRELWRREYGFGCCHEFF